MTIVIYSPSCHYYKLKHILWHLLKLVLVSCIYTEWDSVVIVNKIITIKIIFANWNKGDIKQHERDIKTNLKT